MPRGGSYLISAAVMAFAAMGWLSSLRIPSLPPIAQAQPLQLNIFKSTADILRICRRTRSVFLSILGISWFWLVGAVVLSILPAYCKQTLNANEHVVTFFLALFSLGVGIGSILCEKLSFNHLELGLVPVIPTALQGLWGSLFSRKHRRLGQKLRHNKLWSRVELQIGQPIAPEQVSAPLLQEKVTSLLARAG